jgi:hypothetical protein
MDSNNAITPNSIVRDGKQLQMPILWRQGNEEKKRYSVLNFTEAYSIFVAAYQRSCKVTTLMSHLSPPDDGTDGGWGRRESSRACADVIQLPVSTSFSNV